jgi:hypothetical protein
MPAPKEKMQSKTPSVAPTTSGNSPKAPTADTVPQTPFQRPSASARETSSPESSTGQRIPTREEIEMAAYALYLERGGGDGYAVDDWLQAERELMEGADAQRKSRAKGA